MGSYHRAGYCFDAGASVTGSVRRPLSRMEGGSQGIAAALHDRRSEERADGTPAGGWCSSWPEEIFDALDVDASAFGRESLAQWVGRLLVPTPPATS